MGQQRPRVRGPSSDIPCVTSTPRCELILAPGSAYTLLASASVLIVFRLVFWPYCVHYPEWLSVHTNDIYFMPPLPCMYPCLQQKCSGDKGFTEDQFSLQDCEARLATSITCGGDLRSGQRTLACQ